MFNLFGSAGLAAGLVAGHRRLAAAGTGAHLLFHDLADHIAGALADDLTAHVAPILLDHVAICIGDLIHHMGRDQIAAVDGCGSGAHLQRGDGHCLAKGRGGQLHFAQLVGLIILHEARLTGQVHAGAAGKAKGIEVVIERSGSQRAGPAGIVDIAALTRRASASVMVPWALWPAQW